MTEPTLLTTALRLLDTGYSLLPVGQNKQPHSAALLATGHSVEDESGKMVAAWRTLQQTHPTPQNVRTWLDFPGSGLGIVTGAISGVLVLDADGPEGLALFEAWQARPHTRSRSGGFHWYLRHPGWRVPTLQSKTNSRLLNVRGVDIRADGGYIIAPPTCIGGKVYEALRDPTNPDPSDILPPAVRQLFTLDQPAQAAAAPRFPRPAFQLGLPAFSQAQRWKGQDGTSLETELLSRALQGAYDGQGRDSSGFELACQLRDNRYTPEEAAQIMQQYVDQVPGTNTKGEREAYTLREALHSLKQAYGASARDPWRPRRETLFDQLERSWPLRTHAEREELARCLLGSRNAEGKAFLERSGYDTSRAQAHIDALKQNRQVVPGLNSLRKLLERG